MQKSAQATNRRAFTLVDMTLTILIIGILAAGAAPKFAASIQRAQLESAARKLKADLTFARQRAIDTSTAQTVQFPVNGNSYTLVGLADLDHPGQTYAVNLGKEPYRAVISSASLGGDQSLVFDRFGRPDSAAIITLGVGSGTSTVSVNANTGMTSIP